MLHPSYTEIIDAVNSDVEPGEQPVVQSRYSIVIATAKRARQLIGGEEATVPSYRKKPLSVAVEELHKGRIKILSEEEAAAIDAEEAAKKAAEEAAAFDPEEESAGTEE